MRELVLVMAVLHAAATWAQAHAPSVPGAVDLHLHLTMGHAARPLVHGEPGDGSLATDPRQRLANQVDRAGLEAAGVTVVFAAIWTPPRARPGLSAFQLSVREVAAVWRLAERRPWLAVVTTPQQARDQAALGRVPVFLQLEGAEGITRLEELDAFYALGVRSLTLVHFVSTQLGGAARGQFERNVLGHPADGALNPQGLTPFGRRVVERAMDLGIVIDLAHASDALSNEVLDLAEPRGVPVIVSHTAARTKLRIERNLSDELARRVAAGGGLIGVTLFGAQLEVQPPTALPGSCEDVFVHWQHLVKTVPPEAVVLGSDLNGFTVRPKAGGGCPHGVRNFADVAQVWSMLEARGLEVSSARGSSERTLRLVEAVQAGANPRVQLEAQAARVRWADSFTAP